MAKGGRDIWLIARGGRKIRYSQKGVVTWPGRPSAKGGSNAHVSKGVRITAYLAIEGVAANKWHTSATARVCRHATRVCRRATQ
jgi:hypothetical protein